MDQAVVMDIMKSTILTIIVTSAPMLILALFVGLIISIFQATTSIQEQTLAFAPKIVAVFLSVIVFGPWILSTLMSFTIRMYSSFNQYIS